VNELSRSEPHGGLECGEIVFRREMGRVVHNMKCD